MDPEASRTGDAQPPEHVRDRRLKIWISVIAAAAALLGSTVGVVGSIIAANITNGAVDRRTQRDFLHNQRASVFSTFVGHANQLAAQAFAYQIGVPAGFPVGNQQVSAFLSNLTSLNAQLSTLYTDQAAVELVADPTIYVVVDQIVSDASLLIASSTTARLECDSKPAHKAECDKVTKDAATARRTLDADTTVFVTQGRKQLGS
jgi:hypothetical protein